MSLNILRIRTKNPWLAGVWGLRVWRALQESFDRGFLGEKCITRSRSESLAATSSRR